MLAPCAVVFCVVSIWIVVAFPDNALELLFYFAYMTVACTFLPLPTPQLAMDFGQRYDPVLAAVLGGIGFCISALIDYSLVTLVFRYEKIDRIRSTRTYHWAAKFFGKAPFAILLVAAFTPIPVDPVKLVACAAGYNRANTILTI